MRGNVIVNQLDEVERIVSRPETIPCTQDPRQDPMEGTMLPELLLCMRLWPVETQ